MIQTLSSLKITTERLVLRPIQDEDVKDVYQMHCQEVINQYLPYDTWKSWDDAKHWYAKVQQRRRDGEAEQFVILDHRDKFLGSAIVFSYDPETASCSFGYVLDSPHWGQGIMQEAMQTLVDQLCKYQELNALTATVEQENIASIKLLNKLGFNETTREEIDDIVLITMQRNL